MSEEAKAVNGEPVVNGFLKPPDKTLIERLMDRLYPQTYPPSPMNELGQVLPHITQDTYLLLGWKERLGVLVSGKMIVRGKTYTFDVIVEKAITQSTTSVLPPTFKMPTPPKELANDTPDGADLSGAAGEVSGADNLGAAQADKKPAG